MGTWLMIQEGTLKERWRPPRQVRISRTVWTCSVGKIWRLSVCSHSVLAFSVFILRGSDFCVSHWSFWWCGTQGLKAATRNLFTFWFWWSLWTKAGWAPQPAVVINLDLASACTGLESNQNICLTLLSNLTFLMYLLLCMSNLNLVLIDIKQCECKCFITTILITLNICFNRRWALRTWVSDLIWWCLQSAIWFYRFNDVIILWGIWPGGWHQEQLHKKYANVPTDSLMLVI